MFRLYCMDPRKKIEHNLSYILVPIKKFCKTEGDVMKLITKITKDIEQKKDLNDFKILKEIKPGLGKAIVNSILLEPNVHGIGFSFNKLRDYLK